MALDFLNDAGNAVVVGPNGVGKSTIARNIAHQAVAAGHTVLFTTAGRLPGDLASLDSDSALRRRLQDRERRALGAILLPDLGGALPRARREYRAPRGGLARWRLRWVPAPVQAGGRRQELLRAEALQPLRPFPLRAGLPRELHPGQSRLGGNAAAAS